MLPIRLTKPHKNVIIHHLISLDDESKHLRFGYTPTDTTIENYVESSFTDIVDSIWFGYIDKLKCVGAIHISINGDVAELGMSIDSNYRGQKLSSLLFDRALEYLRARHITKVYMQCLSENVIVQCLAKKYNMKVSHLGPGEKEANVELDNNNPILSGVNYFNTECISLIDSCIRNQIWLYESSMNKIFQLTN